MINIEDISLFNDIRERLSAITDEQIDGADRKLAERTKEPVIGTLESRLTRALHALTEALEAETGLEIAKARAEMDETRERDHLEKAAVLDMFADVAKEMFFAQAKLDLGFHKIEAVGLRRGWLLVNVKHNHGPAGFVEIMRQHLPIDEL